jgi:hypothetical protein
MQTKNYHHDHHHMTKLEVDLAHHNTMDKLPKPQGAWKDLDAKRQAVNNATLVAGVVILFSALIGTAQLGMWSNTLFSPPVDKISKDFPGAKFVD